MRAGGEDPAGFTERVAVEVAGLRLADAPGEALERARLMVLDWLGVTIAGSAEPSARAVRAVVAADGSAPAATVAGTTLRAAARSATLANGIAAHALDFDDTSGWAGGHPSAPLISAAVALAEALGASWDDALEAIVAGLQGQARIALAVGDGPYARGVHTTGTMGTFGAAGACARLLDLDAEAVQRALGLAATQAAGLKVSFGTAGKHLNAARAGSNGLLAAQLAAEGFTAPPDAIEAPQGFAAAQAVALDPERPYAVMGDRLAVESVVFKRHACCHGTHSAIDGILDLRRQRAFAAGDVEAVRLIVGDALPDVCGIPEPATGLEGKFSIRYAATLALSGLPTGPASFTDAMVRDPDLVALRDRVHVDPVPGRASNAPTTVEIDLVDGERLVAEVDVLRPSSSERLADERTALVDKFGQLAAPVVGDDRAAALVDRLMTPAAGAVGDVMALAVPEA